MNSRLPSGPSRSTGTRYAASGSPGMSAQLNVYGLTPGTSGGLQSPATVTVASAWTPFVRIGTAPRGNGVVRRLIHIWASADSEPLLEVFVQCQEGHVGGLGTQRSEEPP